MTCSRVIIYCSLFTDTPSNSVTAMVDTDAGPAGSTSRGRRLRSSLKRKKEDELEEPEEEQMCEDGSPSPTKEKKRKKKRQSLKGRVKVEPEDLQYDLEQVLPPHEEDTQGSQSEGESYYPSQAFFPFIELLQLWLLLHVLALLI